MHMKRIEVDAHTIYIHLRIGIASESGWTWRPSTYLCTYGKKLYMGIGMVKMRTIGLGIQSALSKKVVFGGKA